MIPSVRSDVVVFACAISAGIHGALAPDHFSEGAGAGVAFLASTVVLGALAVALTRRPAENLLYVFAVLALSGLIASDALAITGGVPLLHPEPEPVDALALVTKAIEATGLAAAFSLLRRDRPFARTRRQTYLQTKGTPA